MKYILTEDKLESLIQNYITTIIGDSQLKHVTEGAYRSHPAITRWFSDNNDIIFSSWRSKDDGNILYIDYDVYQQVRNMFSVVRSETIVNEFSKWFKSHQDIYDINTNFGVFIKDLS